MRAGERTDTMGNLTGSRRGRRTPWGGLAIFFHILVWGTFLCQAQTESPRIFFAGKVLDPAAASRAGAANPKSQERAMLSGTVLDPSDAVIPDVRVDLRNQSTGSLRTAFTDHSGEFRFTGLELSAYLLEIRRNNFKTLTREVIVTSSGNIRMPLTLEIAPAYTFYERVMVVGDPL